MSKYRPLETLLTQQRGTQVPISFSEMEQALGFRLPPSARTHQAWWSNNGRNNVAVKIWRTAGWKTSRVDLAAERVTFVRDSVLQPVTVAEPPGPIPVPLDALTGSALKMVRDKAGDGGDLGTAVADLLQELVIARRMAILDWFARHSPMTTSDSVDLIREDRNER